MLTADQIHQIITEYGYEPRRIFPPQTGYRNYSYEVNLTNDSSANLIVYKPEPGILRKIRAANAVGNFLAAQGLPTRSTLDPHILRLTSSPTRYAALYHYLPGSTIPWEAYTMEHLKTLGASMAQMHMALRSMPFTPLPLVTVDYLDIIARIRTYFADPGVTSAVTRKLLLSNNFRLIRYERLLSACANLPNQQPLHMDFVRGNILFSPEAQITGILDFEKTAIGHPAFDLARTLAFLLVDCKFKSPAQVRNYFLLSGYHKRGGGVLPNSRLLNELVNLFLLYDFYKFLRHNPYENLPQNEHFVRTRQILLEHNLLHLHTLKEIGFIIK